MKIAVSVIPGDVTNVPATALVTAINSGGIWFGAIDSAIKRAAGDIFHAQAMSCMPLEDGQTVIAATGLLDAKYSFRNVVFVVDDLKRKLRLVIYSGLMAADGAGFEYVTLPTIRMGVMLGVVEKSVDEAVAEMVEGVKQFIAGEPKSVKSIVFVVNDVPTAAQLRNKLQQAGL